MLFDLVTICLLAPGLAMPEGCRSKKGIPMTDVPIIAKKGGFRVDVEEGKTYFWCACGRSKSQPFCDGSHKDTSFSPVKYVAEESKAVNFCGCKHTKKQPICDFTHYKI